MFDLGKNRGICIVKRLFSCHNVLDFEIVHITTRFFCLTIFFFGRNQHKQIDGLREQEKEKVIEKKIYLGNSN